MQAQAEGTGCGYRIASKQMNNSEKKTVWRSQPLTGNWCTPVGLQGPAGACRGVRCWSCGSRSIAGCSAARKWNTRMPVPEVMWITDCFSTRDANSHHAVMCQPQGYQFKAQGSAQWRLCARADNNRGSFLLISSFLFYPSALLP